MRRSRGESVVWRSIYDGAPGYVVPSRVVEDSAEAIVLWEPTGVTAKRRVGRRGGPRGRNLLPGGWYVNLELPWRRTAMGFDSRDLVLDIVITEDLSSWEWKDADELEWALDAGTIDAETAEFTKSAGAQAIALLETRAFPFDTDWDRWRPDPAWRLPTLPPHWADGA